LRRLTPSTADWSWVAFRVLLIMLVKFACIIAHSRVA
jgi:hypothetical protein